MLTVPSLANAARGSGPESVQAAEIYQLQRHDNRARSGAGGTPASISTLRTVVADTVTP